MKGDPYWMTARYPGICAGTGKPFKRGERVFRYKSGACYAGAAAEAAASDFANAAQDEAMQSGGLTFDGEASFEGGGDW